MLMFFPYSDSSKLIRDKWEVVSAEDSGKIMEERKDNSMSKRSRIPAAGQCNLDMTGKLYP